MFFCIHAYSFICRCKKLCKIHVKNKSQAIIGKVWQHTDPLPPPQKKIGWYAHDH